MKALAAGLVFVAVAGSAGVAAGFLGPGLNALGAWTVLALALIYAVVAAWRTPRGEPRPWTTAERVLAVVFALFAGRAFLWLFFARGDELCVLSPNNLGDLSLHLTIINFLANGAPFWPAQPIFPAQSLQYPIGVDLLNTLLVLVGVEVTRSLVWVGLLASALTLLALRRWGGAFALAGFLANGGLAGFLALGKMVQAGSWALIDSQPDLAWKSLPLALFVTQRSLLYAIPAGLLLLASWRARYFPSDRPAWKLPVSIEWLLYGTMPLFHVHTFLALSFLLGAWVLILRGAEWRRLAVFIAACVVPATLMLWLVTAHFSSTSVIHLKPGWMQGESGFFQFWLLNFGLLPFLVGAALWQAVRSQDRTALAFLGPAVALFLLCCFVMFAVWEWDNTKLMIWSYLIVLPFLWEGPIARWPAAFRAVTCVTLFFSGFYALAQGLDATHKGYPIASRQELDSLHAPLRTIPANALFAAFPTYNHPLALLGRPVAEGYDGHLFSYGIDYRETDAKLRALLGGSSDWAELARDLRVQYLFWGPLERKEFPGSPQPWQRSSEMVAGTNDWIIYRLK